jgi:hypothetical protein
MKMRFWIALGLSPFLVGWRDHAPPWPHTGPLPDDPGLGAGVKYQTITAGTKSYRPVEPLPWDDIMRRVMPRGAKQPLKPKQAPEQKEKSAPER